MFEWFDVVVWRVRVQRRVGKGLRLTAVAYGDAVWCREPLVRCVRVLVATVFGVRMLVVCRWFHTSGLGANVCGGAIKLNLRCCSKHALCVMTTCSTLLQTPL